MSLSSNTLDVLDLFGKHGELTVPELSALTGWSRSSIFRMLATLEAKKYVRKTADAKYSLDVKLISLGNAVTGRLEVIQFGHPFLVELTAATGETSHMGVLDRDVYIRFVDKVLGTSSIRMDSIVGLRRKAHLVGCGKVLLAYRPPAEVEASASMATCLRRPFLTRVWCASATPNSQGRPALWMEEICAAPVPPS